MLSEYNLDKNQVFRSNQSLIKSTESINSLGPLVDDFCNFFLNPTEREDIPDSNFDLSPVI